MPWRTTCSACRTLPAPSTLNVFPLNRFKRKDHALRQRSFDAEQTCLRCIDVFEMAAFGILDNNVNAFRFSVKCRQFLDCRVHQRA